MGREGHRGHEAHEEHGGQVEHQHHPGHPEHAGEEGHARHEAHEGHDGHEDRAAAGAGAEAAGAGLHMHDAVAEAQPFFGRTFMVSVVRSAAIKTGAEMEVLTRSGLVRGRPAEASEFRDLWHRTREQIVEERHDPTSRVPEIVGGDFLELVNATLTPLAGPERAVEFDRLLLFTDEIVGIHPIGPA